MKEKKHNPNAQRKKSLFSSSPKEPKTYLKVLGIALFSLLLLAVCLCVSYKHWINNIGDGAYKYSDAAYEHIENAISTCTIPDAGLDVMALQQEVTKFVASYENGATQLVCSIRDGYFNAEVTTMISENYSILSSSRNYNSLVEYMQRFWADFGLKVLLTALIMCGLIESILLGGLSLISYIFKKLTAKRQKAEKPLEEEATQSDDSNADVPFEEMDMLTPSAIV